VKAAVRHKGYALVDVLQPCVVFNKQNTYQWFKETTYYVDESYDKTNKLKALEIAFDLDRLALGIIYQSEGKPTYETLVREGNAPLYEKSFDKTHFGKLIDTYK
jgi:2-oxoglutarate ferredoxin oxidoreductase subunit beta